MNIAPNLASEAELGAMFITAQEMVVMRQTLQEMKWPQPKSPLQIDNSAAAGVVWRGDFAYGNFISCNVCLIATIS